MDECTPLVRGRRPERRGGAPRLRIPWSAAHAPHVHRRVAGAYTRPLFSSTYAAFVTNFRGLHSFTFQLNLSRFCR